MSNINLEIDPRTIVWMIATLYLLIHVAIWSGLARYHNRLVSLWSVAGILSALGLYALGLRGQIPDVWVMCLGAFPLLLGIWGRQLVLRKMSQSYSRKWLMQQLMVNASYVATTVVMFINGVSDYWHLLWFYGFYAFNSLQYVHTGNALLAQRKFPGAHAIRRAGWILCISSAIKAISIWKGWSPADFYGDDPVSIMLYISRFWGISLINVAFIQAFVGQIHEHRVQAERSLAKEQERSQLLLQQELVHRDMLKERDELIRQLTLSHKSAGMGALVASFAHELNQPLAASSLHAEWLKQKYPDESTPEGMVAQNIFSDTQRASDIIRKLRNLFRTGKSEYALLDLAGVVQDVADILKIPAQEKGVRLRVHMQTGMHVLGDAVQLQQVMLNLLQNALQATCVVETRPTWIQVEGEVLDGFAVVRVLDNGVGIALDQQSSVFSLFKTSKAEGMGVGLWLSRSIALAHEGELVFDSLPGQQTVFTLRIPMMDTQAVH
ncbi:MAG: Sensor histidine kinase TmoS [Pseudomonadota bacterium]|jgi:signal transduction histidine kinase